MPAGRAGSARCCHFSRSVGPPGLLVGMHLSPERETAPAKAEAWENAGAARSRYDGAPGAGGGDVQHAPLSTHRHPMVETPEGPAIDDATDLTSVQAVRESRGPAQSGAPCQSARRSMCTTTDTRPGVPGPSANA